MAQSSGDSLWLPKNAGREGKTCGYEIAQRLHLVGKPMGRHKERLVDS